MSQKVLRKFQAFDVDGKNLVDFQIKFIEAHQVDEALKVLKKFFLTDEVRCRSHEAAKNPKVLKYFLKFWREIIESEKVSVGCFKVDGENEKLIGVNVLGVNDKNDKEKKPEIFTEIREALFITKRSFDVFKHYKVDKYLFAYGLTIDRDYRGRGIATEMLKARVEVLKFLNLKVTSTIFTSAASQKAAIKAGFEENLTKTYEEIHKIDERIFFPGLENECMKVMSMKI